MHIHFFTVLHTSVLWMLIASAVFGPHGAVRAHGTPREQVFVVSAYYSPEPDQCCYVRGSLEADQLLNGRGTHAADGTPVYPGMAAAPVSYPFGTRIALPGMGVFAVHDRGGAIQERDGAHRIDLWMGTGEEGLARALTFGMRTMTGTVFATGGEMPTVSFRWDDMDASSVALALRSAQTQDRQSVYPRLGDRSERVRLLQEHLHRAGYFDREATGYFGPVTQSSLAAFLSDVHVHEPHDRVTDISDAYVRAAVIVAERPLTARVPLTHAQSDRSDIAAAQRLLRLLGYYRGRTDGRYSAGLQSAIVTFQMREHLVDHPSAAGAGSIGLHTQQRLTQLWNARRTKVIARGLLDRERIRAELHARGALIDTMLRMGMSGPVVRLAQQQLAERGYFPHEAINGSFGPQTQESVIRYQLDRGIVRSAHDVGAGSIGPQTAARLADEQITATERMVRAQGWGVL